MSTLHKEITNCTERHEISSNKEGDPKVRVFGGKEVDFNPGLIVCNMREIGFQPTDIKRMWDICEVGLIDFLNVIITFNINIEISHYHFQY
jgi:hypothetical protein